VRFVMSSFESLS